MTSCTSHEPNEIEVFEKSNGDFELSIIQNGWIFESGRALMGENNY